MEALDSRMAYNTNGISSCNNKFIQTNHNQEQQTNS
jgi:hypothetical protein